MRINIMEGYVTLEDFKKLLDTATNVKDVHLLCHQAGCPIYIIRNTEDKCHLLWHPMLDEDKNTFNITVNNSSLSVMYEGVTQEFTTVESMCESAMLSCVLGTNPFEDKYLVWSTERGE